MDPDLTSRKRRNIVQLSALAIGMFAFAFALVPLYEVFCEITGLNGKTSGSAADITQVASSSGREVRIQFLGRVGNGMPWEFRPTQHELHVRVGELNFTDYYARNRAAQSVTGQAVPSVSPGQAAQYLHKVECFCFNRQRLAAGEDMKMPVRFYVGEDLPEDIHTISLSYTLFRVEDTTDVRTTAIEIASIEP